MAQNSWIRIATLAANPALPALSQPQAVRFYLQLGDSFYFYDDVIDDEPRNLRAVLAANLCERRHPRFLDMARVVPSCAVWDDHDFRKANRDSTDFDAKAQALSGFLQYWGNRPRDRQRFGLTTLVSYGNVDIYLMDGRFRRDKDAHRCFGTDQVEHILTSIAQRGASANRLVILASGSTWNHTETGGPNEAYGEEAYEDERQTFYSRLNVLMGNQMKGLVFLSGDIHVNEIYEIELLPGDAASHVAPEFVSSPLGNNISLHGDRTLKGGRKWSVPSEDSDNQPGRRGFATLRIDTSHAVPEGHWSIEARYYDSNASIAEPYFRKSYVLNEGQFVFT